jgi:hypothetical protein
MPTILFSFLYIYIYLNVYHYGTVSSERKKETRCNKKKKEPQITPSYSLKTRYRALKKIHRMKKKPTNIPRETYNLGH